MRKNSPSTIILFIILFTDVLLWVTTFLSVVRVNYHSSVLPTEFFVSECELSAHRSHFTFGVIANRLCHSEAARSHFCSVQIVLFIVFILWPMMWNVPRQYAQKQSSKSKCNHRFNCHFYVLSHRFYNISATSQNMLNRCYQNRS